MSETSKKFEIHKNIVDLDKYPLKWQIEKLTYAIENFHKFKEKNCCGLCYFFDIVLEVDYDYDEAFFTLFNNHNSLFHGGLKGGYWWTLYDPEPRIKFLEWMLTETKKLDHGTK